MTEGKSAKMSAERALIMKHKGNRLAVIIAAVAAFLMFVAVSATNGEEYTTKTVTVAPGDTLWSLWEEHGHGRADKWIAEVRSINQMDNADIYPLDVLCVPVVAE